MSKEIADLSRMSPEEVYGPDMDMDFGPKSVFEHELFDFRGEE